MLSSLSCQRNSIPNWKSRQRKIHVKQFESRCVLRITNNNDDGDDGNDTYAHTHTHMARRMKKNYPTKQIHHGWRQSYSYGNSIVWCVQLRPPFCTWISCTNRRSTIFRLLRNTRTAYLLSQLVQIVRIISCVSGVSNFLRFFNEGWLWFASWIGLGKFLVKEWSVRHQRLGRRWAIIAIENSFENKTTSGPFGFSNFSNCNE